MKLRAWFTWRIERKASRWDMIRKEIDDRNAVLMGMKEYVFDEHRRYNDLLDRVGRGEDRIKDIELVTRHEMPEVKLRLHELGKEILSVGTRQRGIIEQDRRREQAIRAAATKERGSVAKRLTKIRARITKLEQENNSPSLRVNM